MSREVTREETFPLFLTPEDVDPAKGDVAVCRCGLSDDHPFCDGSHRDAQDEGDGVYRYVGDERKRVTRVEFADGSAMEYPVEDEDGDEDDTVVDGDDTVVGGDDTAVDDEP